MSPPRKGPFKSTRDVCASGLIEAHGIASVSVAGHPEGHPFLELPDALERAEGVARLGTADRKRASMSSRNSASRARRSCNGSAELDRAGIDLPVIVGLAGPATPATLTKFALRCGIGNSMRALRAQIGRFGRLLTDTGRTMSSGDCAARLRPQRRRSRDFTCSRSAACARPATGCATTTATRSDASGPRCRAPGFRTRRAAPGCRPGSSCGSPHPAPTPEAGSAAARRRSGTAASRR